jgi:hypothetical protein
MGPPRTAVDTPALWPSLAAPSSGPVLALSRLSTRTLLCLSAGLSTGRLPGRHSPR